MARKVLDAGFTGDVVQERGVATRAKTAVQRVKDEAGAVAAHAADHPTATGSALAVVGLMSFALGYMLGSSSASRDRHWYH